MTTSQASKSIGPGYEGVAGSEKRFRDIFRDTLRAEMLRDEDVFLMGEDISGGFDKDTKEPLDAWGGPFAATKGLVQEFGPDRIRDAPISEAGFVGAAVGSALTGLRPVVDLMYFDFVTVAFDQLLSNAAKSRYMFGGQTRVPLTLFARSGAGTGHAAQHSESFYSILAHIPGLKVVVPSDPYSVKGLLAAAIRDDDPVFLVNDKKLINLTGFVPDEDYIIELGKGRYMRRGTDVTLVGMSYTSVACQKAAEQLAEIGIDAEVIDMMSLSPFDEDILIESVAKTNNVVIVDEDTPRASMASEFAAVIADKAFDHLDAPVKRVTAPHAPVPYNRDLEIAFMPQPEDIVGTVKNTLDRE
ncbi:MAG: alpha-ketoacid dehydrogenase subunit beta [Dehalococcoidia bacterium]|jgi:pyruvate dehydrogenase E1 component beta subunit|nr:alpha-ketoacid dehydrogenase subunit beta [Chloroflexota bacterium]MDP6056332.1 alpha-ketoacid dehydrogenase subunit beta [Dehalococcoidia bacterium]MDP7091080.1 alpha-ketoacid dehydrogenase subunit beta [Dehalococcoidia bacterium]MDP7262101.1 alpha-ketoacid dehydrogenase subunit beta [Dehalococcoidia bacterium]MDP7484675.1 alpha-ketoacid dehydrogenase subunit beta [Dehalococcoidia bacterium]|tara:strand:+ start:3158 stop:4228 length:1071 start_codon:yes stop_codon:yes gene_type:complete